MAQATRLDRYAAWTANLVLVTIRIAVLGLRSGPKRHWQPAKGFAGYQGRSPWLVHISTIAALLLLPALSEAGPPLICHPFQTGRAELLPWGDGSSWNTPDIRYDVERLTGDTLRLLSAGQPVIARMENLRRATIYAARDQRVANELLSAVLARALAATAAGTPSADALFDAGYLIESHKQAVSLHRTSLFAQSTPNRWTLRDDPAGNGYVMVTRAIALAGNNADMEFAASLMTSGAAAEAHRQRAASQARAGSLLARNLGR